MESEILLQLKSFVSGVVLLLGFVFYPLFNMDSSRNHHINRHNFEIKKYPFYHFHQESNAFTYLAPIIVNFS